MAPGSNSGTASRGQEQRGDGGQVGVSATPARQSSCVGTLRALDGNTCRRICSGQVVLDLAGGIKELVENSIDAGARSIDVRIRDHGLASFEVADDGEGVPRAQCVTDNGTGTGAVLGTNHATSKLVTFEELDAGEVATLGFRGEALASLRVLSQEMEISTRADGDNMATRITFTKMQGSSEGATDSSASVRVSTCARPRGTTVKVCGIFSGMPVRQREFQRNAKRELAKAVAMLQRHAVMLPRGTRLRCVHQTSSSSSSSVLISNGKNDEREGNDHVLSNIASVFGAKFAKGLQKLHAGFDRDGSPVATEAAAVTFEGYVSQAFSASDNAQHHHRQASERTQHFYINGRPVIMKRMQRVLNETFRSLSSVSGAHATRKSACFVNVVIPRSAYDINVTPDKLTCMMHDEKGLLSCFQKALQLIWEPSRYTYAINNTDEDTGTNKLLMFTQQGQQTPKPSLQEIERKEIAPFRPQTDNGDDAKDLLPMKIEDVEPCGDLAGKGDGSAGSIPPVAEKRVREEVEEEEEEEEEKGKDCDAAEHRRPSPSFTLPSSQVTSQRATSLFDFAFKSVSGGKGEPARGKRSTDEHVLVQTLSDYGFEIQKQSVANVPVDDSEDKAGGKDTDPEVTEGEARSELTNDCTTAIDADNDSDNKNAAEAGAVSEEPQSEEQVVVSDEEEEGPSSEDVSLVTEGTAAGGCSGCCSGCSGQHRAAAHVDIDFSRVKREAAADRGGNVCPVGDHLIAVSIEDVERERLRARRLKRLHGSDKVSPSGWGNGSDRIQKKKRFKASSLQREVDSNDGHGGHEGEKGLREAEAELRRIFDKADFARMHVIGQFNLGFIVARLDRDIFIVDQHASDEAYNFERLQQSTRLNKQPLLAPVPLEMSAAEQLMVMDNLDVFKKNGFDIRKSDSSSLEASLYAVPFSKNVVFGADDVYELVNMLQHCHAVNSSLRPTKVRAMFASRACRSSIMIGQSLCPREMKSILDNLKDLDAPWNCPHGRPTMRHLFRLRNT